MTMTEILNAQINPIGLKYTKNRLIFNKKLSCIYKTYLQIIQRKRLFLVHMISFYHQCGRYKSHV